MKRLLLTLLLAGCGQNAVLELELTFVIPASGSCGRAWYRVQTLFAAETGDLDCAFTGAAWDGAPTTSSRLLLPRGEPFALQTSIVGEGAEQREPLCVRVAYCATEDCTAVADNDGEDGGPTAWTGFRIERAFYAGERTRLALAFRAATCGPDTLPPVGKCEVAAEGCASGELFDWCREDGRHYCE